MLGLFGLLGALLAGVVADSVMRTGSDDDDTEPDDEAHDRFDTYEADNIFGMLAVVEAGAVSADGALEGDGMPLSDDSVPAAAENATLIGGDVAESLYGAGGDDHISGRGGEDILIGRTGDDWLSGGDGDDHLYGAAGADTLLGGLGADVLHGEDGDDTLGGDAGDDALYGHQGDDALQGGAADDTLSGGDGFDSLLGGDGDDELTGGHGRDLLSGGAGLDMLEGGEGSDTIWGQMPGEEDDAADFLNGGTGDDLLMLGAGDFGNGGDGADVFGLLDIAEGDPPMQITDFDPAADSLVVLYDPSTHPDPQLSVESDESGVTRLLLDGVALASLTNGVNLDLGSITLRAA